MLPLQKYKVLLFYNNFGFPSFITNIDDVRGKRRYSRDILQWSKNDFKSKKTTNGDYFSRSSNSLLMAKSADYNLLQFYRMKFLVFLILGFCLSFQCFVNSGRKRCQRNFKQGKYILYKRDLNSGLVQYSGH